MTEECPDGENWKDGDKYCIQDFSDVATEGNCDEEGVEVCLDADSIRSKDFEDDDGKKHVIRIGCPVGEYNHDTEKCSVGTKATQLLHHKKETKKDMLN